MRPTTRQSDDRVLAILGWLTAGETLASVADRISTSQPYVSTVRQRVIFDDLKYSGETKAKVMAGYEKKRGRK